MFEKLGLTRMAQALAAHSGARVEVVARNIANADTPGFRALDVPDFQNLYLQTTGSGLRQTRPGHSMIDPSHHFRALPSGGGMAPNGNDVSLDHQMMKAVQARQDHEMALAVYRSTSSILRASLGRSA